LVLAGCGHGAGSSIPHTFRSTPFLSAVEHPKVGLRSNGGGMESFRDAVNMSLASDAEYASFIDPR
jgi:hypothetical protein